MNVTGMAFPMAAYFSPMPYGGSTGANFGAWVFAHMFFELKMMGIFSMLFGAGLILMAERAQASGRPFGRVYYRRILWLLVIGLVHSYLIWHGDILVTYALCGLVLFLLRKRSARTLLVSGAAVLLFGALLSAGGGYAQGRLRAVAHEIQEKVTAGEEMTPRRQDLVDQWHDVRGYFAPTEDEIEDSIEIWRGVPGVVLEANVEETIGMHTEAVPFMLFWRALALMLLGMGLFKLGVLTGERSSEFYRRWLLVGFGVGLPIVGAGIYQRSRNDWDFVSNFLVDGQFNYFGSVLVSLGYVSLVMLICQAGKLPRLRARLAAVGRMALTNYLLQSVIGVLVFYGYGLGLFGRVDRFGLWWFILAVWALQLIWSPWWLSRFRFGPVEWLWRSLTYWRWQPLRAG